MITISYPSRQKTCYLDDGSDMNSWTQCIYADDYYLIISQRLQGFRKRCMKVIKIVLKAFYARMD